MDSKKNTIIQETDYSFWVKNISLFMSCQFLSLFGSAVTEFAIIWYITLQTKSGSMMAIGTICAYLPRLIITFFSGIWADKYNRKFLVIFSDIGIAFVTLILAFLFTVGYCDIWIVFIALALRSIGTGIQTPAITPIIPQIVPPDKLIRINGLNSSLQSLIMLMAPILSGSLMSIASMNTIFFIDVITATIAVIIMTFLKINMHNKSEINSNKYFENLKLGILYIKKNKFIKELLLIFAIYQFLIIPTIFLSPLLVARRFGEEVWKLTTNEVALSVGAMLGGIIIAWKGKFGNSIKIISMSFFLAGLFNMLLGYTSFYLYLVIMSLIGICISFSSSSSVTIYHKKVEQGLQGRVFSLNQIVSTTAIPLGMLIFAPLGDIMNISEIFVCTGILIFLLSIYVYFNKQLRKTVENEDS